jgi:hypothetical protein
MHCAIRLFLLIFVVSLFGCGAGSQPLNSKKMTEAEIQEMKENDRRIEDDERSGSGTAVKKPKKK